MKTWLSKRTLLLSASVAVVLWAGTYFAPLLALSPTHVMLTQGGEPAAVQSVTWHTGPLSKASRVEFSEASGAGEVHSIAGTEKEVQTERGPIVVHTAQMSGLKASTSYRYQVGDGVFWSESHTFTTAPTQAKPFRFLLFGDSQSYTYELWQEVLHAAYARNTQASFMVNIGDLVDVGLDYGQWDGWFGAGKGVIDTIPVAAVMGNHETYTPQGKIALPDYFDAFFSSPGNGPEGLQKRVYSFDYGDAHFSILDSQRQEEEAWLPQMLEWQQAWLERDLAATKQRWKLVFIHRPLYHNRPSLESDADLRAAFGPIFDRYGVDVAFAGHDHIYARSYPVQRGQWGGEQGNGVVYITVGRSGTKTFARAQPKEWDAAFHNPTGQPNYLTVDVSDTALVVQNFAADGTALDFWRKEQGSH